MVTEDKFERLELKTNDQTLEEMGRSAGGGRTTGAGMEAQTISDEMCELHDLIMEERENAVCNRKAGRYNKEVSATDIYCVILTYLRLKGYFYLLYLVVMLCIVNDKHQICLSMN